MSASVLVLGWRRLLALDEEVLLRVRGRGSRRWVASMRALTALGDATTWIAHGLVLALLPGGAQLALRLGAAALLATLLVQVLKRSCRRRRPSRGIDGFQALARDPDAFSFPSGHTAVACAVAVALLAASPALGSLELALAAGVAFSRVALGAHYPLDVTAGAVLGALCGASTAWLLA